MTANKLTIIPISKHSTRCPHRHLMTHYIIYDRIVHCDSLGRLRLHGTSHLQLSCGGGIDKQGTWHLCTMVWRISLSSISTLIKHQILKESSP